MLKCEQESRGIWHGKATLCWPLTDFQFEEKILARKRNQLLCYNHQTTVIANIPLVSQSISIYIYYGTCERRIYMLLLMLDGWRMATRNWSHVSMWSRVISRDIQLQSNLSFIQKFLDKREIKNSFSCAHQTKRPERHLFFVFLCLNLSQIVNMSIFPKTGGHIWPASDCRTAVHLPFKKLPSSCSDHVVPKNRIEQPRRTQCRRNWSWRQQRQTTKWLVRRETSYRYKNTHS